MHCCIHRPSVQQEALTYGEIIGSNGRIGSAAAGPTSRLQPWLVKGGVNETDHDHPILNMPWLIEESALRQG